jgi:hypothetical protein
MEFKNQIRNLKGLLLNRKKFYWLLLHSPDLLNHPWPSSITLSNFDD